MLLPYPPWNKTYLAAPQFQRTVIVQGRMNLFVIAGAASLLEKAPTWGRVKIVRDRLYSGGAKACAVAKIEMIRNGPNRWIDTLKYISPVGKGLPFSDPNTAVIFGLNRTGRKRLHVKYIPPTRAIFPVANEKDKTYEQNDGQRDYSENGRDGPFPSRI